jgi:hypothetical protein
MTTGQKIVRCPSVVLASVNLYWVYMAKGSILFVSFHYSNGSFSSESMEYGRYAQHWEDSMSNGRVNDRETTNEQLRNPSPPRRGQNWLRHQLTHSTGIIDRMILEGAHSREEIEAAITGLVQDPSGKLKDHISHLENGSEDSRKKQHGYQAHKLEIREANDGKLTFSTTDRIPR